LKRLERGQVLLFIILVLGVIGILAGSLAVMWQSEVRSRSLARQRMIAFYLAEAGLERAKIEVLRNVDTKTCPGGTGCPASAFPGYRELDPDLTDNFTHYYYFEILAGSNAQQRILVGRGEITDANGVVLSSKSVQVEVQGIIDNPPPAGGDGVDDDGSASVVNDTWEEL
jgi:type II secretory pathway pseudopilin PulG